MTRPTFDTSCACTMSTPARKTGKFDPTTYKTALCKNASPCRMGSQCDYAHGDAELRSVADNLKMGFDRLERLRAHKATLKAEEPERNVSCEYAVHKPYFTADPFATCSK